MSTSARLWEQYGVIVRFDRKKKTTSILTELSDRLAIAKFQLMMNIEADLRGLPLPFPYPEREDD